MARKPKTPDKGADGELSDNQKSARYWLSEIDRSTRAFKEYQTKVDKIVARYRDERNRTKENQRRFNILWSNVQTTKPALFAKSPKPVIERRFLEDNEVERIAGQTLERAVEVEIEQSNFYGAVNAAVLDYLLGGRGVGWVRYEAEFDEENVKQDLAGAQDDNETEEDDETSLPPVTEEHVCVDYVDRKDFLHDPARTWEEVRWVARGLWLTKREAKDKLGEDKAKELRYQDMKVEDNRTTDNAGQVSTVKRARLWQIWDRATKRVFVVSQGYEDLCDEYPDPLRLKNFWPCPRPLYATMTNDTLVPVPDYLEYQDQAEEIDDLTRRIAKITQAIKAAGVYDASQPSLKRLLQEGVDNVLIPCETWTVLKDRGGLSGAVELFPLDMLIKTLQVLYEARDKSKAVLYEVTGISDIMRGQGEASETATAQRIKGQFGTIRLQERQRAVAEFNRGIIRIMAELIAEHFAPETLAAMTAMAERGEIEQLTQAMLGGQQPGQDKAGLFMQAVRFLKDDRLRSFRLDIETDSTVEIDAQEEKQARVEFLASAGQFLGQVLPVAQQMPALTPLFGQMLLFGARAFKASRDLESTLELTVRKLDQLALPAITGQQPDPKAQASQQKAQHEQARLQLEDKHHQDEMQQQAQEHNDAMQLEAFKLHHEVGMAQMNNQAPQPPMSGDPQADAPGMEGAIDQHLAQAKQGMLGMLAQHMAAQKQANSPEVVVQQMQQLMQRQAQQQAQALAMMAQSQNDAMMKVAQAIQSSSENLVKVATLMAAPKRVVRDEEGTAIGVETVMQ